MTPAPNVPLTSLSPSSRLSLPMNHGTVSEATLSSIASYTKKGVGKCERVQIISLFVI